ncbi:MAG: D-alanyl-D-alanine carboxypeptidase [Lachnospiraceae bacterium]|nr:D-alanyl-D-alanine carboxypeptidase [Lachnospiraceae bacterium]
MKSICCKLKKMIKWMMIWMCFQGMICFVFEIPLSANTLETIKVGVQETNDLSLTADSAILMEAQTGKVLYEKDADRIVSPASITKIMTLILIFDAIQSGKIDYHDEVTTSEHAKSMGGSQVFLETGEKQTVETLIKCIVIASGNDASVCMAEYIAGSEETFVQMMNERAKGLGMENTVFLDCCGLNDSMEHHTTARDVAVMSRELITKHPEIHHYSTIWMENITHVTAAGSKEFTLANTNKLLRQYDWITGLKTGSTSLAKYCLSATADKDGKKLIAVIMGAKDYKARFSEAATLLNYGYSILDIYQDNNSDLMQTLKVKNGTKEEVAIIPENQFMYVCEKNERSSDITKTVELKKVIAPVRQGQIVGTVTYYIGNQPIGSVNILSSEEIRESGYMDYFKKMWYKYML